MQQFQLKLCTNLMRRNLMGLYKLFEIFQNCLVFNDGAYAYMAKRDLRKERTVWLDEGSELIFGANDDKAIALDGLRLRVKEIGKDCKKEDIPTYTLKSRALAHLMASISYPEFPVPMGIFIDVEHPCYEESVHQQIADAKKEKDDSWETFLKSDNTWVVK